MPLRYFKDEEFVCSYSGRCEMDKNFLDELDQLRWLCGFPFKINSGFRDARHPQEAIKAQPGTHAQGIAADIAVANGIERRAIVSNAIEMGFGGIGVAQTFVHVDIRDGKPVIWCYG